MTFKQPQYLKQLIFLLLIFFFSTGFTQEKDFELWTSIGLSKKINKKLSLGLKQDIRFRENSSRLKTSFSQLSASYKLKKFLSLGIAYRFANKKEYDFSTTHQHLFLTDLRLKTDYRRFRLAYRIRYQKKYSNIYTQENGHIPSSYLRHKWTIRYNIRKSRFSPYIAFELFQDMDYPERFHTKKQRYTIACSHESKNKNEATLFFTLQREINQIAPVQSGILGLKYNFSL